MLKQAVRSLEQTLKRTAGSRLLVAMCFAVGSAGWDVFPYCEGWVGTAGAVTGALPARRVVAVRGVVRHEEGMVAGVWPVGGRTPVR